MKTIGSSANYQVQLSGDDTRFIMNPQKAEALKAALLKGSLGSYIEITNINGDVKLIRTSRILEITEMKRTVSMYKTPDELGMPNLVANAFGNR